MRSVSSRAMLGGRDEGRVPVALRASCVDAGLKFGEG